MLTLNDRFLKHHAALADESEAYQALLYATYDEQAVEGSIECDNYMAACMIRARAKREGDAETSQQKLATIMAFIATSSRHRRCRGIKKSPRVAARASRVSFGSDQQSARWQPHGDFIA